MVRLLLKLVEGELTVCLESGRHPELRMTATRWITVYKRDARVSLLLWHLSVLARLTASAMSGASGPLDMSDLGSRLSMVLDDGRLLVEPQADADGLFRGSLSLRNASAAMLSAPVQPARHRIVLTLAELRWLARMEVELLRAVPCTGRKPIPETICQRTGDALLRFRPVCCNIGFTRAPDAVRHMSRCEAGRAILARERYRVPAYLQPPQQPRRKRRSRSVSIGGSGSESRDGNAKEGRCSGDGHGSGSSSSSRVDTTHRQHDDATRDRTVVQAKADGFCVNLQLYISAEPCCGT